MELLKASASPADRVLGAEGAAEAIRAKLRPDTPHPSKARFSASGVPARSVPTAQTTDHAEPQTTTVSADTTTRRIARSTGFAKFTDARSHDHNGERPPRSPQTRPSRYRSALNAGFLNQTAADTTDGPKERTKKARAGMLPIALQRLVAPDTRILSLLFGNGTDDYVDEQWLLSDRPVPPSLLFGKWTEKDLVKQENRLWRLRELIALGDSQRIRLYMEHEDVTGGGRSFESVVRVNCIRLSSVLEPPLDDISDLLFYVAIRYVSADGSTDERFRYARAWVLMKRWAASLSSRGATDEPKAVPWRTIELEMYIVIAATIGDSRVLTQTMLDYLRQFRRIGETPTPSFDFASGVVIPAYTDRLALNLEAPTPTCQKSFAVTTARILQAPCRRTVVSTHVTQSRWLDGPFLPDRADTPVLNHPLWLASWAKTAFAVPAMSMFLSHLPVRNFIPTTNNIPLAIGPPMVSHTAPTQSRLTVHQNEIAEVAPRPLVATTVQQQGSRQLMYPVPTLSSARPSLTRMADNAAAGGASNAGMRSDATHPLTGAVHRREISRDRSVPSGPQAVDIPGTCANRSERQPIAAASVSRSTQIGHIPDVPYVPDPLAQPRTGRADMPSGASSRSVSAHRARHIPHPSISTVSSVQPTPAMSFGSNFSDLPRTGHSTRDASYTRLAEGIERLLSQDEPNTSTNDRVSRDRGIAEADVAVFFGAQGDESRDLSDEPIYMGSNSALQPEDQAQLSACRITADNGSADLEMAEEKAPAATAAAAVPRHPAIPPKLAMPPGMTPENRPPTIWRSQTRAPPVGRPVRKRSASSSNIPVPMPTVVAPRSASQSRMDFIIGTTRISSAPGPSRNRYQGSEPEDDRAQRTEEAEDADAEEDDDEDDVEWESE